MIEPPCTERYARWCERSASQLMGSLLLDYTIGISKEDAEKLAVDLKAAGAEVEECQ